MLFKKKESPYVMFITKKNALILGDGLKTPVVIEFSDDVVIDLEIVNIKSLENAVISTLEQQSIKASELIVLLSSELYYYQEFTSQADEPIQQFLTLVPFEEVVAKTSVVGSTVRVCALSNDFLRPLVGILSTAGFQILGICPDIATGKPLESIEQFTVEYVSQLLMQTESLLAQTIYTIPKNIETVGSIRHADGKIFSPKLILMILFFLSLLTVLGVLLYSNGYFGGKDAASSVMQVPEGPQPTSAIALPVEKVEVASEAAHVEVVDRTIDIEVRNGSGIAGQADQISEALEADGFENITTGNATGIGDSTLVIVRTSVNALTRNALVEILQELELETSIQENPELDTADVVITTGRVN